MWSNCYLRGRGLHGAAMRDVFCVTLSARALSDPVIMDNLKLSRRAAECFPHTAFQRPPRPSSPSPLTASSVNCTPVKLLTLFCFLDISRARLLVLHLHQKKKKGNDSQTSESNFPSPSFPPAKCFTVISDSRSIQAVISNAADWFCVIAVTTWNSFNCSHWLAEWLHWKQLQQLGSVQRSLSPCALQEQANPFELASFQLTC